MTTVICQDFCNTMCITSCCIALPETNPSRKVFFLDDDEDDNCFQIADEKNDIDQMVNNQLLANAMKQLTDAQRNIIRDVFLKDQSMQSCSKKYGITKQTCFVHKERALEKLKQALTA